MVATRTMPATHDGRCRELAEVRAACALDRECTYGDYSECEGPCPSQADGVPDPRFASLRNWNAVNSIDGTPAIHGGYRVVADGDALDEAIAAFCKDTDQQFYLSYLPNLDTWTAAFGTERFGGLSKSSKEAKSAALWQAVFV